MPITAEQFRSLSDAGQVKGLTLWQPWATLVATGDKRIETRSWGTSFRGMVLIHAAVKPYDNTLHENGALGFDTREALDGKVQFVCGQPILPRGTVVAVARLKHCIKHHGVAEPDVRLPRTMMEFADYYSALGTTETMSIHLTKKERQFGDYSAGRFAWYLGDVTPLASPVPTRGYQQIWQPTAAVIAAVTTELESRNRAAEAALSTREAPAYV